MNATECCVSSPLFEVVPLALAGDAVNRHCETYANLEHVKPRLYGLFTAYILNIPKYLK